MNFKAIYLTVMGEICNFIGKDPMKYKIKKYRMYGAKVGENVRAFSPLSSAESYLLSIGDNVTVATGVRFITHDNSAIKIFDNATDFVGPIEIGNNVFIGANSTILPGVHIADNCVIGAGAVVCSSFPSPGSVIAGNPAKVISNVENMKEKYINNTFDFRQCDKRKEILMHPERWLNK